VAEIARGEVQLDFPAPQRDFGVAVMCAITAGAWLVTLDALLRFLPVSRPVAAVSFGLGAALLGLLVVSKVTRLRFPGRTSVRWDGLGVSKRQDDAVLVSIPWASARMKRLEIYRKKSANDPEATLDTRGVQITDESGRAITLAWGGEVLGWMERHPTMASDEEVFVALTKFALVAAPAAKAIVPDAEGKRHGTTGCFAKLAILAWLLATAGFWLMAEGLTGGNQVSEHEKRDMTEGGLVIVFFAGLLLLVRLIRPFLELRRIAREEKRFRAAKRVTLVANERERVTVQEGDESYEVDVSRVSSPDATIAERRGPARLVLEREGVAAAIEMDAVARARALLRRAVRLELLVRLAVVLLAWAPLGVVVWQEWQEALEFRRTHSRPF
jgi:hypothetical protein